MANLYTLLTGADGYIGARLARKLLQDNNTRLHLWVRADSPTEFAHKVTTICAKLPELQASDEVVGSIHSRYLRLSDRVVCSYGNLADEYPFAAVDTETIGAIVHSAAVTRFNVESELADQINVQGNRRLMRFAHRCPNLAQYLFVSSIYASGLQSGEIKEAILTVKDGFSNHYERSKWESETDVVNSDLPWKVARVATVVSDSQSGEVSQFNAVHNTLKLFYYGMLSIIPGTSDSTLYFVTGDYVAEALHTVLTKGRTGNIYHVSHDAGSSIKLGNFIDTAYTTFLGDAHFKKRRVLPPVYSDLSSFLTLSDSMINFGQGIMSQASSSISPFARQLFITKNVRNSKMTALLPAYEVPEPTALLTSMCSWLTVNKWGRRDV